MPGKFSFDVFRTAVVVVFGLFMGTAVYAQSISADAYADSLQILSVFGWDSLILPEAVTGKPQPVMAKGLYLTAYSAANPKKLKEIIDLLKRTELNSVVIDIKDYSGLVLYKSALDDVNNLKTDEGRLGNVKKMIARLHREGIYVIARQTVFQDPVLAEKRPDLAIKNTSGRLWRDRKGLAWVDPTNREVWDYNIRIAKEAIGFGFDEINFDYVRFPSDGNMSTAVYAATGTKKYEIMGDFYRYLNSELSSEPAWISIDMFGFVMEKTGEDDMNIGQRLADAINNVDYVCPMMYPSHYPAGHLGFSNPAAYPAAVIENGMKAGIGYFVGARAKLRPWIQDFNMGAVYGAEKIRAQIDVVEKYTDAGWFLWNASNRYSDAGLKEE